MDELPTELGRTMRKWRMEQGDGWTMERAATEIDVSNLYVTVLSSLLTFC
jgi:hypothetical protein